MSYTAIRGFSLGSRPPLPLGGGNVAALQHEGRVGSGDQEGPFGPKEGAAEHLWAAAARPRGPRERWAEARGRRGGLDGQRDSLHRPCSAEAAREVARGPRPGTSRGSGGWGPGREERAVAASGLPGTWRASPRPGEDPAPQAGADRARRDPGEARGVSARRKLDSGRLDSRLLLRTPAASFQGRPREGRISGTTAAAPGGRGGGGGRLARRLRERPGGPGLSPPQPPPLAAGGTRSDCARRGRKLSDLASSGRHSDSD